MNCLIFSAERLNLYLEKDEGEIENIDEDGIHKDAAKDKTWRKVGRICKFCFFFLVKFSIFHFR